MFSSGSSAFRVLRIVLLGVLSLEATATGDKEIDKFKYMVTITTGKLSTNNERRMCSGTIISDRHILTTAGKLYNSKPEDLTVVGGIEDFTHDDGLRYTVQELTFHPQYVHHRVTYIWEYDVGVILVRDSMIPGFDSGLLQQLFLPYKQPILGEECIIEVLHEVYFDTMELRAIPSALISQQQCTLLRYVEPGTFYEEHNPRFICTHRTGEIFSCKNNIGNPLVHGAYVLGLTSKGGCQVGNVTLYTNVRFYSSWIFNVISSLYKK